MMYRRPAAERGNANFGWLDSHHTFSFGSYYDPQHMGFGVLRVINDDRVAPGAGFPPHGHQNMEIISVVLEGGLAHKDSMGNGSTIVPGDIQRMSAGTGVRHSEFNASDEEPVHFLQIWVLPDADGYAPGYEEKHFSRDEKLGQLRLVASRDGREGSLSLNQDLNLYQSILTAGDRVSLETDSTRRFWVHVVAGDVSVNGEMLTAGDGLGLDQPEQLSISAAGEAEFLLFEMDAA